MGKHQSLNKIPQKCQPQKPTIAMQCIAFLHRVGVSNLYFCNVTMQRSEGSWLGVDILYGLGVHGVEGLHGLGLEEPPDQPVLHAGHAGPSHHQRRLELAQHPRHPLQAVLLPGGHAGQVLDAGHGGRVGGARLVQM